MKALAGILLLLILAAHARLSLPARPALELYDVQDLVVTASDMGIDLPLAAASGQDLVGRIQAALPGVWTGGGDRSIRVRNGVLIVRATAARRLALRLWLAACRARLDERF
jgi:hypothetical protein